MRLLLLPISTRQSLLYCHKVAPSATSSSSTSWADKITTRASNTWYTWESQESGLKKKITEQGNRLLKRVPFEEWGLKSVPPLNTAKRRQIQGANGKENGGSSVVGVEFPRGFVEEGRVLETLKRLGGEEKQNFHRKWLVGSLVGMPVSAPFGLIPLIPNLPFFYLCFRAWSHWRARAGSKHLEFLLQNSLTRLTPSSLLRTAYEQATMDTAMHRLDDEARRLKEEDGQTSVKVDEEELILSKKSGKAIAESLEVPALETEIDRAIWQVESQIRARKEEKGKENSTTTGQ